MYDVLALGELLVDFVTTETDAQGYPTLAGKPGGAPANFLAAAAKYGCRAAMLGKVGDDAFGHLLVKTLTEAGIDAGGIVCAKDVFTTLAFVTLDENGDRSFSFARKPGADTCLTPEETDAQKILHTRVFHFGTLSLTDEPSRSATQYAVGLAKEHGAWISFDPNLRKPLWTREEDAMAAMDWGLRRADIVKISDDEMSFFFGCSPEDGAKMLLSKYGVSLVYATLGAKGCYAANRNAAVMVPVPKGIRALDTTGAGDIFGGSAMSRLLALHKHPRDLNQAELLAVTRFACCAAALSTQTHGGINSVPAQEQVLQWLADDGC